VTRPRSQPNRPTRVHVRMYQAGFGDCFLISFYYRRALADGRGERHMLIDFGSTHAPRRATRLLPQAATLIEQHTNGQLDVLVATHRHKDHIDGFGLAETAAIIDTLKPRLVVRPWTDDPKLPADATGPRIRSDAHRHAVALATGQNFAALVASIVGAADRRSLRGELASLALDQLPNKDALDNLERWGKEGTAVYVAAGDDPKIDTFIPGIRSRVLGPPTAKQAPEMTSQRANDPEYWLAQHQSLKASVPASLTGGAPEPELEPAGVEPGPVAWLVERLHRQQVGSLLRVVRTVDDALNNTSVILLIDVGDKRLLFPGDAQIENWSWALKNAPNSASLRKLLSRVDLYKVGHHGSRNATPRSLFRLWGDDPTGGRTMVALMSTLSGVHGRSPGTRVPRTTLVAALKRRTADQLWTTDSLAAEQPFIELASPATGRKPFTTVAQQ
jgi:hypothetical protein